MEYYPRIIEENIERWLNRRQVTLLRGPRQSGKTTLFLHLNQKLKGKYVSLDDEELLEAFEENPRLFVERFDSKLLFIDEAQYSKKAGRIIKLISDSYPDVKLFVTGSGSFDIKVLISKYLVGRAVSFELFPLNFQEFLLWKAKDLAKIHREWREEITEFIRGEKIELEKAFEREFRALLEEFLIFGGFPEIVKEEDVDMKIELLKNLYRMYLEKDVFFFLRVRHLEKFREMMRYLAFSSGNILQVSSLMSDLKMDYKTVDSYLSILVNSYIIRLVSPFYKNLVTEIKKSRKVYFVDPGFRNAILNNFTPLNARTDRGQILENFVLNEFRDFEMKYWRTTSKSEVDFVLLVNNEVIPIEIKSFGKIKRSFRSFLSTYKPSRAIVFTEKEFGLRDVGRTEVLFIPHWMV